MADLTEKERTWTRLPERSISSPVVERQKSILQKLEVLLVEQIKMDQEKMADLLLKLQKIKHGGGG